MIVVIVETNDNPIAVIGMTRADIHESEGALPPVDLKMACFAAGIYRPPTFVQVLVGETDEDIERFVHEAFPNHETTLVAKEGDTVEDAINNGLRIRAEQHINQTPGRLN